MNKKFNTYLDMYHFNERIIKQNPCDYYIQWEQELLYGKMIKHIPQSHYDQINEVVYGIKRLR